MIFRVVLFLAVTFVIAFGLEDWIFVMAFAVAVVFVMFWAEREEYKP